MPLEIVQQSGEQIDLSALYTLFDIVLEKLQISKEPLVNLIITNDEEVRRLNREYRNKDKTTDVLSFTYKDDEFYGVQDCLGEIVISFEQIVQQAKEHQVSVHSEMNKIFVHGILHLFGYDHEEEKDFLIMKKIESDIISAFHERNNPEQ